MSKSNHEDIDVRIFHTVEKINRALRKHAQQIGKSLKLTPLQLQILVLLKRNTHHKPTVSFMADEFDVSEASISESLQSLASRNFIIKESDPDDRRRTIIRINPAQSLRLKQIDFISNIKLNNISNETRRAVYLANLQIIQELFEQDYLKIARTCLSCEHFVQNRGRQNKYYCQLLNSNMQIEKLQYDCPEHLLRT